jgi:hypothetical protein
MIGADLVDGYAEIKYLANFDAKLSTRFDHKTNVAKEASDP